MDHQPGQTAAGRAPRQLLAGDPLLPHRRARRPTRLSGQLSRSLPVQGQSVYLRMAEDLYLLNTLKFSLSNVT